MNNLTGRILIAMALGIILGALYNALGIANMPNAGEWLHIYLIDGFIDLIGQIFLASLKLMVVPLVFISLVAGAANLKEGSKMGPMALQTIGFYLVTTAIAITIALLIANLINPGKGMDVSTEAVNYVAKEAPSVKQTLINIVPTNPIKAMAEGNMLQIIVFALLMGFAIPQAGKSGERIAEIFNDLNEIVMKMVNFLMQLAPYGVFCLLIKVFSELGLKALADLFFYVFTLTIALLIHGSLVYPTLLKVFTGLNPLRFIYKIRPAIMFAFSTSSSGATIPITLETVEERIGVNNKIASFTIPLGATINMDGTAIMQGVATVFIAQAFNVDMAFSDYIAVILTATMASIGTAAVPGVGLITLAMVLNQVGLPVEGIALILGVDRLMDMIRTAINVTGDATVSTIIANKQGMLDKGRFIASD